MERAATGGARIAADVLEQNATQNPAHVRVLCGPGNNGGDGYAVARLLSQQGANVEIWETYDPAAARSRGDAMVNRSRASELGLLLRPAHDPDTFDTETTFDLSVDAIFGTGLARPPEGAARLAIEAINRHEAPIVSLDVPSGFDADRGVPIELSVRATATVTFGLPKQGFFVDGAEAWIGDLYLQPIGLPEEILPSGIPSSSARPIRI